MGQEEAGRGQGAGCHAIVWLHNTTVRHAPYLERHTGQLCRGPGGAPAEGRGRRQRGLQRLRQLQCVHVVERVGGAAGLQRRGAAQQRDAAAHLHHRRRVWRGLAGGGLGVGRWEMVGWQAAGLAVWQVVGRK